MVKKVAKKAVKKVKNKRGPKLRYGEKGMAFSTYLPRSMFERLIKEAEKQKVSKNDVLHSALTRYFA